MLDRVAAHYFVAHLVLVLADHQTRVLLVAVALVGDLLVPLQLFLHGLRQILFLVIGELG